jgi:membrane-bound metal-dependent hydrolase YbcI (DUF457 family)
MAIAGVTALAACWGLRQAGMDIAPVSMVTAAAVAAAGGLAPDLDHPFSLASFAIPSTLLGYGGGFLAVAAWQKQQTGPQMLDLWALGPGYFSAAWIAVWVGALLLGLSLVAAKVFGHRGPVHSIAFGVIATVVVAIGLAASRAPLWWALAFAWGWASHLAADATTKMGLPSLLWPLGSISSNATPALATATGTASGSHAPAQVSGPAIVASTPLCPVCGIEMVLRMARHGDKQGQQFYGCANFPQCRQTRQL